ncbi:MAG: ABC transporter ATP-binding protein [Bacteroidetes bacterium]|nr:MAG: ABC transporter ATP-binding protein [Bacteroidota bacterium]
MSVSVNIEEVTKSFGEVVALNAISLQISPGELFGFIGPDGSGKTTLFRILTSLMLPDSGKATVDGLDVVKDYKKIRRMTGYMPGRFSLYGDLSVEENMEFYASIFHTSLKENYDLVKDIYSHIEPFKKRKASALSGGMKQKLALSCALIHRPKILLLDEPTTGVDAVSRKEFWELLKKMQQNGITILVSTPYMDEASLCDQVALMQNGNLLATNKPEQLISEYKGRLYEVQTNKMQALVDDLRKMNKAGMIYRFGEFVHVTDETASGNFENKLEEFLVKTGHGSILIREIRPVIEDSFLALMDKEQNR